MGCFSAPSTPRSKSEKVLAGIARQQYEYYKSRAVPLEKFQMAETERLASPEQRKLAVNRSINAARMSLAAPAPVRPGTGGSNVIQLARAGARGRAMAGSTATSNYDANIGMRRVGMIKLGRGQSVGATQEMGRLADAEAGNLAATTAANSMVNAARANAIGQVLGAGIGAWMTRPPPYQVPPELQNNWSGSTRNPPQYEYDRTA